MRVYTKATPKLKELWENYKGLKSGDVSTAKWFDNTDQVDNTGNFTAYTFTDDIYYEERGYKEVSEQEFIDIINNNLAKVYEGVKESEGKLPYELDWSFVEQMAERMQSNKHKYEPYNWKKPIDIDKLLDSLTRHFISVQKGIYEDDGRPFGHLEAISCISMMVNYQLKNN